MKELTQEYVKELFNYKDGILYWKIQKGNRVHIKDKAGTLNSNGYYHIIINQKIYKTHRLIFLYHNGYIPDEIDHIDRNKSNNKIENLRSVTKSQNQWNRKSQKGKLSKYKGVSWHKASQKWQARIQINNKQKYLGLFINEIDAAITYNKKAIELFKEFAYLNEVEYE